MRYVWWILVSPTEGTGGDGEVLTTVREEGTGWGTGVRSEDRRESGTGTGGGPDSVFPDQRTSGVGDKPTEVREGK